MDDDHWELVNRLFAAATALLEDAVELAAAGQSPHLDPAQLADHGRRLQTMARDIAILAEAAVIVVEPGDNHGRNRLKRPKRRG